MKELTFSIKEEFFITEQKEKERVLRWNAVRHRELKVLGFVLILMSMVGLIVSGFANFEVLKSPFFENNWLIVNIVPLILGIGIFSNLKVLDEKQ